MKRRSWDNIASSADGEKLIATAYPYVYTSTDGGDTWKTRGSLMGYIVDTDAAVGISGDGSTMVAAATPSYIYTSTDDGETWTEQTGSGSFQWTVLTVSYDGQEIAAARNSSSIYTSTDGGVNWTAQTGSGSRTWNNIVGSDDGAKLVATANSSHVYTSLDSGVTWVDHTVPSGGSFLGLAVSSNGNNIVVGQNGGNIFTSTDFGDNWTLQDTVPDQAWRSLASSADGVKLVAGAYGDKIYTSTDSGVTWTPNSAPGNQNWIDVTSSSDGTTIFAVGNGTETYINRSINSGTAWATSTMQISAGEIYGIAASSDGIKLLTGSSVKTEYYGGGQYTSTNSAASWTERDVGSAPGQWKFASSADGASVTSVMFGGYVYTSTNSGVTWATSTASGARNWQAVDSSSDGTKIVGVVSNGHIYTTTDSGANWTDFSGLQNKAWKAVTSSTDGVKLAAVVGTGYIYTSADSGSTWATSTEVGSRNWSTITSSSDGTELAAAVNGGYVYTSTDSGSTWATSTAAGSASWTAVAMSSDGSIILAGGSNGLLSLSSDGGTTWDAQPFISLANAFNIDFSAIAMSSDGSLLYVVEGVSGSIWSASQSVSTPVVSTPAASSGGGGSGGSGGYFENPIFGPPPFTPSFWTSTTTPWNGNPGNPKKNPDAGPTFAIPPGIQKVLDARPVPPPPPTTTPVVTPPAPTTTPPTPPETELATTTPAVPEQETPSIIEIIVDVLEQIAESIVDTVVLAVEVVTGGGGGGSGGVSIFGSSDSSAIGSVAEPQATDASDLSHASSTSASQIFSTVIAEVNRIVEPIVDALASNQLVVGVGALSLGLVTVAARSGGGRGFFLRIERLSDVGYSMMNFLNGLMTIFGLRKRRRYWGTVYDSLTKQPLDPAYVELIQADTGKVVEQSFTDLEGKFGFLDRPGTYTIRAKKTHYRFPSEIVVGTRDGVFENVYHGETFEIHSADNVIAPNIPMDQLAYDWNQSEKKRLKYGTFNFFADSVILKLLEILFWSGFVTVVLQCVANPTVLNGVFVFVYILLIALTKYLPKPKLWGKVVSAKTSVKGLVMELRHASIPGVVINKTTTNANGKFFLKAAPGAYLLQILSPAHDVVIQRRDIHIGKNMIVSDIIRV